MAKMTEILTDPAVVQDEYPKTRIIGICFGLQVIARAFGPSTIKENPKGW